LNEGVIKFNISNRQKTPALDQKIWQDLEYNRNKLHKLKLIGFDEKLKLGYGNISMRYKENKFIITASQTGHLDNLNGNHYLIINDVNFRENSASCKGPALPSSETLTHAACYYYNKNINLVAHIHSKKIWEYLLSKDCLSTPKEAEYGSFLLYNEIIKIMKDNNIPDPAVIVMKGHEDGVIFAGSSITDTINKIIEVYNEINH